MKKIVLFLFVIAITSQTACPGNGPVGPVLNAVVDCLGGGNRPKIDQLINEVKESVLGGGSISWPDMKQRATQAGVEAGGCFIMELTQWFLSGTRAAPDAKAAHDAAESFRAEVAGGATFKTMCVREDGTKSECKL